MRLRTGVHRRVTGPDGTPYVYVAASAAILAVDAVSDELVQAFAGEGQDSEAVLQRHRDPALAAGALKDLIDMGVIRPTDEPAPPRAPLPPMPFPLATLVLNVTNKCNLSCTYCYEYGADRLSAPAPGARSPRPMMLEETARQSIDFLFRSCGERPVVTITFGRSLNRIFSAFTNTGAKERRSKREASHPGPKVVVWRIFKGCWRSVWSIASAKSCGQNHSDISAGAPPSSRGGTIAPSTTSTPSFSSSFLVFAPSLAPKGGSTCGAASTSTTRALRVLMERKSRRRVRWASSAI